MTAICPPDGPVLITGCSSGIGRATAARLSEAGFRVVATARQPRALADLEARCECLALDVTDEASMRNAVARIESSHGAVAALVNNAGYGLQGPLEETPVERLRHQLEVNVVGVLRLCQLVLPGMRRRRLGRIVNLSSMGGRLAFPGGGAYHASKHALEAMSDVLRFEVSGFGIDVVVIEPGPVQSAFGLASLESLDDLVPADDGAYATFRERIRSGLEATFVESPGSVGSAPDAVALAIEEALTLRSPPPRIVVGEMARHLIAQRRELDDVDWDAFLAEMFVRPGAKGSD
jgi:NAD(P)-dependent dehydrogenase (short-subunit alcohol dehydrogenase family)